MNFDVFIQALLLLHIALGSFALLSGAVALIVKKGSKIHKLAGKVFFYTMLSTSIIALIISILPNHQNPFLFCIGLFSAYFIVSGYRSLKFKSLPLLLNTDKIIAYIIMVIGLIMIFMPIVLYHKLNIVMLVFGIMGVVFGYRDHLIYKDELKLKKNWLKIHLGKMTGGYIAAVSAFFVVNNILQGVWNWFTPGIIGGIYISYWLKKLK